MQGFEMLLYGTKDTLYNYDQKKWVVGSQGFKDSLNFVKTVFSEGLAPSPKDALSPNMGSKVGTELLPQQKLAIDLDGSWIYGNWLKSGAKPWPQWSTVLGQTAMPTQDGGGKGKVSLSGGWTWAIPKNSDNADKAWAFIQMVSDREHHLKWDIANVQIPVRKDVASDPSYLAANPTNEFFASLVPITTYRPAYAVYPRISNEIQVATESVVTGTADVPTAANTYTEQVKSIAGDAVMTAAGS
jgi:multiple sugar transport system substrate-binding protein